MRPTAVRWAAGVGISVLSLAGCLLTSSFDDVAGVRPDGGAFDAANAADAVEEIAVSSGGDDAGVEASTLGFCASAVPAHRTCADFDDGKLEMGGWGSHGMLGGTATLDTVDFVSPPASFRSKLPALLANGESAGILFQNVGAKPSAMRYAFDLRIVSCLSRGGNGSIAIAQILPTEATLYKLVIRPSNLIEFLEVPQETDAGSSASHALLGQPKVGEWTRVVWKMTVAEAGSQVELTFAGKPVLALTTTYGIKLDGTPIVLNLGASAIGPTDPCDIEFDNVTFDVDL